MKLKFTKKGSGYRYHVKAVYVKIALAVVAVAVVILLVLAFGKAVHAGPMTVTHQRRITVFYGNTSRRIRLEARAGRSGAWTTFVSEPFNLAEIPSFGTPVGYKAAKALRARLESAANMSWGAKVRCTRKDVDVVTWKVQFHHWTRWGDGTFRHRELPVKFTVKAYMTKKGKIKVVYYAGTVKVGKWSIDTLLMKQSTTVNTPGLGTYVPDIR